MGWLYYIKKGAYGLFVLLALGSFFAVLGLVGASDMNNEPLGASAWIFLGGFALSSLIASLLGKEDDEEWRDLNS